MSERAKSTLRLFQRPIQCPACSYYCHPQNTRCPACGKRIEAPTPAPTELLEPLVSLAADGPAASPRTVAGQAAPTQLVLQFLPSGQCVTLALGSSLVLGRSSGHTTAGPTIDLSSFKAEGYGVSRHHCRLQRHSTHITITDLGSTNSTYLNGEQLLPHQPYILADQDRLILGTLRIIVTFLETE